MPLAPTWVSLQRVLELDTLAVNKDDRLLYQKQQSRVHIDLSTLNGRLQKADQANGTTGHSVWCKPEFLVFLRHDFNRFQRIQDAASRPSMTIH